MLAVFHNFLASAKPVLGKSKKQEKDLPNFINKLVTSALEKSSFTISQRIRDSLLSVRKSENGFLTNTPKVCVINK